MNNDGMSTKLRWQTATRSGLVIIFALAIGFTLTVPDRVSDKVKAQSTAPSMTVPNLSVRTAASGLNQPISMAFLGRNDFLVLEKATGKVQRVVNGTVQSTVLDLGVNFNSERGLLGIALHPQFPANNGVYLFWTCRSTALPADPFFPDEERCLNANMFAADTDAILQVPLLGNRVDRLTGMDRRLRSITT